MTIAITFDADWAPDFVLKRAVDILGEYDIEATFFLTNSTDIILPQNIEVAIHPDLFSTFPSEENFQQQVSELHGLFPSSIGIRTHRMYWDFSLYEILPKLGLSYDSSLLLPFFENLAPFRAYGPLVRIPVWWTDNLHLDRKLSNEPTMLPIFRDMGLKVMIFHPINIFLNSASSRVYGQSKEDFSPLIRVNQKALEKRIYRGDGMETFLRKLCHLINRQHIETTRLDSLVKNIES